MQHCCPIYRGHGRADAWQCPVGSRGMNIHDKVLWWHMTLSALPGTHRHWVVLHQNYVYGDCMYLCIQRTLKMPLVKGTTS